jgi:chorismate dehydratase
VDVGLIPSIEYQRIPGLRIVPGIAIASTTPVRSVILVRRRGREVRSVALDTSSRTSAGLVQILLPRRFGITPEYVHHAPDVDAMLRMCDAALLIGDRALQVSPEDYDILDLAEAWIEWQSRPFVFAFWACRPGLEDADKLCAILEEARAWGWQRREEIAETYSRHLSLPKDFLMDYLLQNIDYRLTARHIEGLERFYALAAETGLIPELQPVRFIDSVRELQSTVRG